MLPHPSARYRLYIDETGIQSLKTADSDPYLCLMGIVMKRAEHDGPTTLRLRQLKADLFGHAEDTPVILHRRELVRGEPPFDRLHKDDALAADFRARWFAFVSEVPYIAMGAGIDKRAHIEKYKVWRHDPYHYCLECLLERYVSWLNRHGFVGDVVIEARGKHPDKRLKNSYGRFYQEGNRNHSPLLVQGSLTSKELKFALKTDDVAAIQLADSLAYPTLAYMKARALKQAPPATFGQSLVDVLVEKKFARHPTKMTIPGWGLKLLP